ALADFWRDWRQAEDRYVAAENPVSHVDYVVAGDPSQAHDSDEEFVILSERPRAAVRTTPPG
ncbi:MAG TPA: hypothetical protein VKJ07_03330, partial [Mycobacteriales bacterium]|nr:hypothetical protein [Mycobacteriales bacterium]